MSVNQRTHILVFQAERAREEQPRSSGALRWLHAAASCCCWVNPWRSQARLGRALRAYLVLLEVEILVLGVVICTIRAWLRLIFIACLCLQCALIVRALWGAERHKDVNELRRFELDVRGKLGAMACCAWPAPMWWFFEFISQAQGRWGPFFETDDADAESTPLWQLSLFPGGMLLLHFTIAVHLLQLAWDGGVRLLQNILRPTKLWSRRFAELSPGEALTDESRCPICLADYEEDDEVLLLPCRHLFHAACLTDWLPRSSVCPMRCECAVLELPIGRKARPRQSPAVPAAVEAAARPGDAEAGAGEPLPTTLGAVGAAEPQLLIVRM